MLVHIIESDFTLVDLIQTLVECVSVNVNNERNLRCEQ